MRNLIIFLSTFTLTVLLGVFMSTPANAGGAGGSWGCPDGWTTKADGSCSFDGGGGGTGGGGGGGSWDGQCTDGGWYNGPEYVKGFYSNPEDICTALKSAFSNYNVGSFVRDGPTSGYCSGDLRSHTRIYKKGDCVPPPEPEPEPDEPPPEFPPLPPPSPDCDVCQALYEIKLKINHLKNQDINNITNIVNNMQTTINNIDNSITDLSVNQEITNNYLTNIDNSMGDLITNIENNNITNNEIFNTVNNINNYMNDYSLKLGDIQLALGDISVDLDNTNRLVLDLGVDLDFIKNKMIADDSKDYTPYLEEIIRLLAPCVPTEEQPCPNDDEVVKKLKEIQDYMQADFVPDTDSTAVEVEDLTNIELDRNLIKFGVAQCPPDNEFSTMVNGFSFSGGFKHKPLCDFFTLLSPFIKAFGGFSAALILGGGLRRG